MAGNIACENGVHGFDLNLADSCELSDNTANENQDFGFYARGTGSGSHILSGNIANSNGDMGFVVYESSDNMFLDNTANLNVRDGFLPISPPLNTTH